MPRSKSDLYVPNLKAWRIERGLTVSALADAAGVTRQTVTRLEAGEGATAPTIAQLAQALGLKPHELLNTAPGDK